MLYHYEIFYTIICSIFFAPPVKTFWLRHCVYQYASDIDHPQICGIDKAADNYILQIVTVIFLFHVISK